MATERPEMAALLSPRLWFSLLIIWASRCLAQKDCTGVDCPMLENCIEQELEVGACCSTCVTYGCECEGYQYYDCINGGFRNGKVPEGSSYLVDYGSTECLCPQGGGRISCRFILCPELAANCIQVLEPADGCQQCAQVGCLHDGQKYTAGHTFHMPPCKVCHCPNAGGELMCYPFPYCNDSGEDKAVAAAGESEEAVKHYDDPYSFDQEFSLENDHYPKPPPKQPKEIDLLNSSNQHKPETRDFPTEEDYYKENHIPAMLPDVFRTTTEPNTIDAIPVDTTAQPVTFMNRLEGLWRRQEEEEITEPSEEGTKKTREGETREDEMIEEDQKFEDQKFKAYDVEEGEKSPVFPTVKFSFPIQPPVVVKEDDNAVPNKQPQTLLIYPFDEEQSIPVTRLEPGLNEDFTGDATTQASHHRLPEINLSTSSSPVSELPLPTTSSELPLPTQGFAGDVAEMCCAAGQQWSASHGHCFDMSPQFADSALCRITQSQCCVAYLEESSCFAGMTAVKEKGTCSEDPNEECGTSMYKKCCDCCELGILFRGQAGLCEGIPALGYPCSQVYLSCCQGAGEFDTPEVKRPENKPLPSPTLAPERVVEPETSREALSISEEETQENSITEDDLDECTVYAGQLCEHICLNTPGSYQCSCSLGYQLQPDQTSCRLEEADEENYLKEEERVKDNSTHTQPVDTVDKDLCRDSNPCMHNCTQLGDGVSCSCRDGYRLLSDHTSCDDVNECLTDSHSCSLGEICINTFGSFRCQREIVCGPGFQRKDNHCQDVDECMFGTHNCSTEESCVNSEGSFQCVAAEVCKQGLIRNSNGDCVDVNECLTDSHSCSLGEICINTFGSFRCQREIVCGPGFQRKDNHCQDVDECMFGTHNCSTEESCVNSEGSFQCVAAEVCKQGLIRNSNGDCVDVNECLTDSHSCSLGEICINTFGSFRCQREIVCGPGFQRKDNHCQDIDECEQGTHNCAAGYDCVNTPSSFHCRSRAQCSEGFLQDAQGHCHDINECSRLAQPCTPGFNCINTVGSYTCQNYMITCGRGYHASPEGTRCVDIDECQTGLHRCGEGQQCHNAPGSYRCDCKSGYQYNALSRTCIDVNECWRYPGRLCAHTCENTPGSYYCSCSMGFRLSADRKNCEDVNECESSPCGQECANVYGSYQCYCRLGFQLSQLDGHSCTDIDECTQSGGALCMYRCLNVPGSYTCACPEVGYTTSPNGRSCVDIDECAIGSHNCSASETCFNIEGGFRCLMLDCPPNYRRTGDTRCERISCNNYMDCQNIPVRITFYHLSFSTNVQIPSTIFRISPSPAYVGDSISLSIAKGDPEGHFGTRKLNAYTGTVSAQRPFREAKDFLLDVEMKLWRQGSLTSFLAKIYVFVTAPPF
ncbi:fibulin-2 [Callorhinchus milii]|uniref:fibulin-2 n=1 Tax=Callorhinchus milii TaxID=7868 RepID=UPI001C3F7A21|nr:fibulin-2 [Callorhinchus milii]XP_042195691.1 fibulin-2 [Callorhinchus milii]